MANTLEIQVKGIKYPKIELDNEKRANGEIKLYYIMDAVLKDNSSLPVVGFMPYRPQLGERLTVVGKFTTYQGLKQFTFDYAEPILYLNYKEMLHYAVERTSGFGEVLENEIWTKYGENWAKNIKPNGVKGLTQDKYDALVQTITQMESAKDRTKTISWLLSHKLSVKFAEKAYELFGGETISMVSANPYNLTKVDGFGFLAVDNGIRQTFDINDSSPLRLEAAIIYTMHTLTERGDTLVDWNNLANEAQNLLKNISIEVISQTVSNLFTKGWLMGFPQVGKIALTEHYKAERQIYDFISANVADKSPQQRLMEAFSSAVY